MLWRTHCALVQGFLRQEGGDGKCHGIVVEKEQAEPLYKREPTSITLTFNAMMVITIFHNNYTVVRVGTYSFSNKYLTKT